MCERRGELSARYLPAGSRVVHRNGAVLRQGENIAPMTQGDGVDLPVLFAGARLGTLVLIPEADTGVSVDQRRVALALADLLASGLARGQVTAPHQVR